MTKMMITCLTEHYERMGSAVAELRALRDSSIHRDTTMRLNGKIEGVELSMGYLYEAIRELRRAQEWTEKFEQANG